MYGNVCRFAVNGCGLAAIHAGNPADDGTLGVGVGVGFGIGFISQRVFGPDAEPDAEPERPIAALCEWLHPRATR